MNDLDRQIRARVAAFVDELTKLVKKAAVEAVSHALGGKSVVVRPARAPKAARKSYGKGQKRSPAELAELSSAIASFVGEHPGIGAIEIARALGIPTKDLVLPMKKLLTEGALASKGQKRATKYYRGKK